MGISNRYERNMLLKNIGLEGQKKLNKLKVLVCGAGGLGSSVLTNLACIGIETIGIIDFDRVSVSNLNRQFIHNEDNINNFKVVSAEKWLKKYNSNIKTNLYDIKLTDDNTEEIILSYDIAVDCFDNWESKFLLNKICIEENIPFIHLGVENYMGQVMTIIPHKSACLECIIENRSNKIDKGIISPIVNIIGSIGANEVINFTLNKSNLLTNTILSYDINNNTMRKIKLQKNHNCKICGKE